MLKLHLRLRDLREDNNMSQAEMANYWDVRSRRILDTNPTPQKSRWNR